MTASQSQPYKVPEFARGAKEIGRVLGLGERTTFRLLESGQLTIARKLGGRWMADKAALLAMFGPERVE